MTAPAASLCAPGNNLPGTRIIAYLKEVLKLEGDELRMVGIRLQASLSDGTPGSGSDLEYKVPQDQDLVIVDIRGYLRFPTLNTEPQSILGFLNLDPSERIWVKSQNCLVTLKNKDRSKDIFDNGSIPLSTITPPWGSPMQAPLELPWIVGGNTSIRADMTLQDTTTAIVGNATIYGLLLSGALVPKDVLKRMR